MPPYDSGDNWTKISEIIKMFKFYDLFISDLFPGGKSNPEPFFRGKV